MWMVVIGDHAYQGRQAALKNEMIFHLLQSFSPPRDPSTPFRKFGPSISAGACGRRIDRPVGGGAAVIMVLREGKTIQIKSGDGGEDVALA